MPHLLELTRTIKGTFTVVRHKRLPKSPTLLLPPPGKQTGLFHTGSIKAAVLTQQQPAERPIENTSEKHKEHFPFSWLSCMRSLSHEGGGRRKCCLQDSRVQQLPKSPPNAFLSSAPRTHGSGTDLCFHHQPICLPPHSSLCSLSLFRAPLFQDPPSLHTQKMVTCLLTPLLESGHRNTGFDLRHACYCSG